MQQKGDNFLQRLLSTFEVEAREHINAISSGLIELENTSTPEKQTGIIEMIFREAHSLKGAARAVNAIEVEAICQSLEGVFSALKRKDILLSPGLFDLLHKAVDTLGQLLRSVGVERTVTEGSRIQELIHEIGDSLERARLPAKQEELKTTVAEGALVPRPQADQPVAEDRRILAETVRISTAKLNSLLLQAEELLSAKLAATRRAAELREITMAFAAWKKERAKLGLNVRAIQWPLERDGKRSGLGEKNPQLPKLLEFLEWDNTLAKSLEARLTTLARSAEHDYRSLGGMVTNLLEDMKKVLMLPFSLLLEIFPKFARDLSHEQGKEVDVFIQGAEIEIDRRILEEMKDPLIHLVRNAVDHGIESPQEREKKKKPRRGTVTFAVSQKDSNKIEILVSDDGAGIDVSKVQTAASKLSILGQDEAENLNEQQVLSLVFHSGVSTSPIITDISGRGLGLAIVREKVEKLGGIVALETYRDVGTAFRILLPVTLATFRGVLVRVNDHLFVLPTTNVERVVRVSKDEVKTVGNRETIQLNGQTISLVRLGDALELPTKSRASDVVGKVHVVILGFAEKRIAFQVDEIYDEQEVLVKRLGKQLSRVRNVTGATALATGKLVPILNVPDLMKSAVRVSATPAQTAVVGPQVPERRKSILIAEDSITARTLLKTILESAGYNVKTAVDGVDAFTTLRTEDFDLVVSDVDMPRMSGFDLTAKIRAEKKLSDLPVVLVTALESREDRERGIDVGANAYIVKSSFDQSNLLAVIRRLI